MSAFKDLPGWGALIVTLIGMCIAGTLAYGAVKTDVSLLQQKDTHFEQTVLEIKQMLKEELERHHPRNP
jgi:hypothetical protein